MQIDVVIATCNRQDLILDLLRSLQTNTLQDFHVWIVDQSDDTVTAEIVKAIQDEDSRFYYLHTPLKGVNLARNLGIAAGSAPLVALTDDDCRVSETWLEALAAEYATHPECDAVFGQVQSVSISETAVPPEEFKEISFLQYHLPLAIKEYPDYQLFSGNRLDLGFGHGANMSFRRNTFVKHGLFDEFLGNGAPLRAWPELDIGYRILASGGKILYTPQALVYHMHWRTWAGVKKTYYNYAIGTGAAISKYIRTGDWGTLYLLQHWFWLVGIRNILSGVKNQVWQKIYVGLMQLIYPWVGIWQSRKYDIDKQYRVYIGKHGQTRKAPTIYPPPSES